MRDDAALARRLLLRSLLEFEGLPSTSLLWFLSVTEDETTLFIVYVKQTALSASSACCCLQPSGRKEKRRRSPNVVTMQPGKHGSHCLCLPDAGGGWSTVGLGGVVKNLTGQRYWENSNAFSCHFLKPIVSVYLQICKSTTFLARSPSHMCAC